MGAVDPKQIRCMKATSWTSDSFSGMRLILAGVRRAARAVYLRSNERQHIHFTPDKRCAPDLTHLLALGGPQELATTLLVGLVSGGLLTAITTKWKISFHSGSLAGALTILIWFLGGWALLLIPALPAVGWSRVHMKKHTVTQVLAGAVAATALAAVVLGTLQ